MRNAALLLGAVSALQLLAAPALAHFGILRPLPAFRLWLLSALPGLAAIAVGVLGLLLRRVPAPAAAAAILLGLAPLLVAGSLIRAAKRVPRINDVTTDLDDPPAFVQAREIAENRGRSLDYPDRFKPKVREAYGDLAPVVRDGPAAALFERALAAAKELGWTVTAVDAASLRFEAVATSSLWQFHDDVVVRVREQSGKARLDVRSKSRDGKSDFGANAARIRAFAAKL